MTLQNFQLDSDSLFDLTKMKSQILSDSLYKSHLLIDKKGDPVVDVAQFKIKFFSYLVHSFDVGIMFQKYSYRVDQFFDCILLHSNQIDNFYKTLEEIYLQDVLDDYMKRKYLCG